MHRVFWSDVSLRHVCRAVKRRVPRASCNLETRALSVAAIPITPFDNSPGKLIMRVDWARGRAHLCARPVGFVAIAETCIDESSGRSRRARPRVQAARLVRPAGLVAEAKL